MAKKEAKTKNSGKKAKVKDVEKSKAKKTGAKAKARSKKAVEAVKPVKRSFTNNELIQLMARQVQKVDEEKLDNEKLNKKIAKALLDSLSKLIRGSIAPGGVGEIKLFGLMKVKTKKVKARKIQAIKKGTMVANPFNGGKMEPHKGRPASIKPAHVKVKVATMKGLKDAANQ